MSTGRLTNAEIRARGWEALVEKLGPSGALRFAMQTERGRGDYPERRHRVLGGLSVNQLLADATARETSRSPAVVTGASAMAPARTIVTGRRALPLHAGTARSLPVALRSGPRAQEGTG